MAAKRPPAKKSQKLEASDAKLLENLPEVALAAIASYRMQKEVSDFINFMLEALDRNSNWLNNVVGSQPSFKCVLMTGAGPNRFQTQEIIYPSTEDVKLAVELNDSADHDQVALAALLRLSNADVDTLLRYMKSRMCDNPTLKDDLLKGKGLGISFAVLRPISEGQYRVMERIVIGSNVKCVEPCKKRRREEKSLAETILRKTRRFV